MGNQTKSNKPWLNSRGYLFTDDELKSISKSWTRKTWEEYLDYIETPRTESILDEDHYTGLAEKLKYSFEQVDDCDLQGELSLALINLTDKQREILEFIFWDGLTTRDIGFKLNISSAAVQKIKDRALISLKKSIEGVNTLRIIEGDMSSPFLKRGEQHESKIFKLQIVKAS